MKLIGVLSVEESRRCAIELAELPVHRRWCRLGRCNVLPRVGAASRDRNALRRNLQLALVQSHSVRSGDHRWRRKCAAGARSSPVLLVAVLPTDDSVPRVCRGDLAHKATDVSATTESGVARNAETAPEARVVRPRGAATGKPECVWPVETCPIALCLGVTRVHVPIELIDVSYRSKQMCYEN